MNQVDRLSRVLEHISVRVEPFSICMLESGWRLTLPPAPAPMLHFVIEGAGWLGWANGVHRPLGSCCIAIVPPGLVHSLESGTQCEYIKVIEQVPEQPPTQPIIAGRGGRAELVVGCGIIHAELGASLELFENLPAPIVSNLSECEGINQQLKTLRNERNDARSDSTVLRGAIMTQLMIYALRQVREDPLATVTWLGTMADPKLTFVLNRLLNDPCAPHSVETLAREACMSRSAFAEQFQETFGISPMRLLKNIRMRNAADLLLNSEIAVTRVARLAGFANPSYFSRAFRAHFGKSPLAYRSEWACNPDSY